MSWTSHSDRRLVLAQPSRPRAWRGASGFGFACPGGRFTSRHCDDPRNELPDCYWQDHRDVPRAQFPMCFTREALEDLLRSVGMRYPETGAKGFGPKDRMGFDVVEFDQAGSASAHGAMYAPDVAWSEARRLHHMDQPDDRMRLWTGDVHSHPGYSGRPSASVGRGLGDLGYAERVFEENEWMEWFLMPILTGTGTREVTIHPWVIHRDAPHRPMIASSVELCSPEQFPERTFNRSWLRAQQEPHPEQRIRHHGIHLPPAERQALELEYTRRLEGVVSPDFRQASILVVGLGAGSHMVEKLARLVPGRLTLCDLDVVEVPNLSRTVYTIEDAITRRSKTEALVRRLLDVTGGLVELRSCSGDFTGLSPIELDELFDGVDVVVAGTDQFEAQAGINLQAVERGIPAVFIGIHRHGFGGRIVGYVPGESGCYRCAAAERYEAHAEHGERSTDLAGAVGTIMDSQLVDMVALKLLVALLERGRPGLMGGFLRDIGCRTDIIVRCDPRYEHGRNLWDGVLADLPGDQSGQLHQHLLFSMDSAWLANPPDPGCPVCGAACAEPVPAEQTPEAGEE
jgi:molybdopterin/thiamine biosynthesis adenylyltransferase